jgi:Cu/Ag efflux pump CusA
MISAARRHLPGVSAALATLVLAALAALPFLGGTFMPDFKEGHFVVQASSSVTGTSLVAMKDMGQRVSAELLTLPYVQSVEQQIGRAELSEDTWGPHRSEFHIELKPDTTVDQSKAEEQIREIVGKYPGLQTEVVTFLGDRISESLSGETAQVAVKVFGDDLDGLDQTGEAISAALANVPGIADLNYARQSGTPAVGITLRREALVAAGLRPQAVLDAVAASYAGDMVGQSFEGIRAVDTVVILPTAQRNRIEELQRLMITGPYGPVPLKQVAEVRLAQDRYSIEHDGGQRRVSVTFNVQGRPLQAVVDEAKAKIASTVTLPEGVYLQFTGAAEAERQTRNELLLYSALGLALIVLILVAAFQWRSNAWLVMANLPFSLIGSVLAIAVTGIGLSLGAIVGLVTVFGVSARNSILQLAHYEHLVEVEGLPWSAETVVLGANERLIPILMTAAVTALGLAPLAFGLHEPGQEIQGPMAVTVLGGLFSSTLLNLLVLPALALRFSRK